MMKNNPSIPKLDLYLINKMSHVISNTDLLHICMFYIILNRACQTKLHPSRNIHNRTLPNTCMILTTLMHLSVNVITTSCIYIIFNSHDPIYIAWAFFQLGHSAKECSKTCQHTTKDHLR